MGDVGLFPGIRGEGCADEGIGQRARGERVSVDWLHGVLASTC